MPVHQYWNKGIGPYDDDAPKTLPAQLELLRSLESLRSPDVALVYRLVVGLNQPEDDPNATFDLRLIARDQDTIPPEDARSIDDLSSVGLLPGYHIWGFPSPRVRYKHHVRLVPVIDRGAGLPVKADWALVVDLMRRRGIEMALELACQWIEPPHPRSGAGESTAVVHVASRDAATDFFLSASSQCSVPEQSHGSLLLTVSLHATEPLDDTFVKTIGRQIYGVPVTTHTTRRFSMISDNARYGVVGCPEQLIRVWHAPYGNIQGRGLNSSRKRRVPARSRFRTIEGGLSLGRALYHGVRHDSEIDVVVSDKDRSKHVYIIGKTGSGKTNLLKSLVRQDIINGRGCAVIDPHGDLVDYALEHAGHRVEDVVLLDFGDPEYLPVVNPFELDVTDRADYSDAIDEILEIIVRRSYNQFTGPVFDDTTRMIFKTVYHPEIRGSLPPSVPLALEVLRTPAMRKWVRTTLASTDPALADEWQIFDSMLGSTVAEQARWAAAKFADFVGGNPLQLISASPAPSPLSLKAVYEDRKVLLVRLPDVGLSTATSQYLGSLFFSRLYQAARSSPDHTAPFYIYADEFQQFVSHEVEKLVAEARKFNIGLTFAHQNLRQLEAFSKYEGTASSRLAEAIFSNVGTMIVMKISGRDVTSVANELSVTEGRVREIAQYDALVRAVVDDEENPTFSLIVPKTEGTGRRHIHEKIRKRMIAQGFWQHRDELAKVGDQLNEIRRSSAKPTKQLGSADRNEFNRSAEDESSGSSFLDDWLAKRKEKRPDDAAPNDSRPREPRDTRIATEEEAS